MKNAFVVGSHHGLVQEQLDHLKAKFEEFLSRF
jgi:tRNA pseudouridine-54 N-methylase